MFTVGKHYEFEMHDPINDGMTYCHAEILAVDGSLLKVRDHHDEKEWFFNTGATLFVRAKEINPPMDKRAFAEALAEAAKATETLLTSSSHVKPT